MGNDTLPPEREGALYYRELPDGRDLTVWPLSVSWGQLAVSKRGSGVISQSFYYATRVAAVAAAKVWDGNGDAPVGWFRHPNSGRAGRARLFLQSPHRVGLPPNENLVSSAEVERRGAQDRLKVWNRGGLAGELVVTAGDGELIAALLGLVEHA